MEQMQLEASFLKNQQKDQDRSVNRKKTLQKERG